MGSGRLASKLVVLLLATAGLAGCSRTFSGSVTQPNPLAKPTETLRESEAVDIVTGDMELETPRAPEKAQQVAVEHNQHYPLHNMASFTVVSRDRLRFHVQLEHKWEEWADLRTWEVYLIDDKGNRYLPESVEHANTQHLVTMWDREIRSVQRNMYGDIVAINEDGWRRRQALGSLSVFRGRADFVFYKRNLFTPDKQKLKLVVKRSGQAFEFNWRFADQLASDD